MDVSHLLVSAEDRIRAIGTVLSTDRGPALLVDGEHIAPTWHPQTPLPAGLGGVIRLETPQDAVQVLGRLVHVTGTWSGRALQDPVFVPVPSSAEPPAEPATRQGPDPTAGPRGPVEHEAVLQFIAQVERLGLVTHTQRTYGTDGVIRFTVALTHVTSDVVRAARDLPEGLLTVEPQMIRTG